MHVAKTPLYVLSCLLFAACDKVTCAEETQPKLAGSWQWQSTRGGIAGNINQTPASTGTQKELRLTPAGRFIVLEDGAPVAEGAFSTSERTCIHDKQRKTWIAFAGNPAEGRMVEQIAGNVLVLSDEAYDGVSDQYTRIAAD